MDSSKRKILVVANRTAPFAAVGDVLHSREFDEVIVSVLPRPLSGWLALGLPARLRRAVDLPVLQVTGHSQPLPAASVAPEPAVAA